MAEFHVVKDVNYFTVAADVYTVESSGVHRHTGFIQGQWKVISKNRKQWPEPAALRYTHTHTQTEIA